MYPFALHKGRQSKKLLIWLIFLALPVAGLWIFGYYRYMMEQREKAYDPIIQRIARKYCIDSRLLKAVIWQESRFRADARGSIGEVGLMQVRPDTKGAAQDWANFYGCPKPCPGLVADSELNVEIGGWYLARALRRWKNYDDYVQLALCEYNAGQSSAATWKPVLYNESVTGRITYPRTRAYVREIMKKYNKLSGKEE